MLYSIYIISSFICTFLRECLHAWIRKLTVRLRGSSLYKWRIVIPELNWCGQSISRGRKTVHRYSSSILEWWSHKCRIPRANNLPLRYDLRPFMCEYHRSTSRNDTIRSVWFIELRPCMLDDDFTRHLHLQLNEYIHFILTCNDWSHHRCFWVTNNTRRSYPIVRIRDYSFTITELISSITLALLMRMIDILMHFRVSMSVLMVLIESKSSEVPRKIPWFTIRSLQLSFEITYSPLFRLSPDVFDTCNAYSRTSTSLGSSFTFSVNRVFDGLILFDLEARCQPRYLQWNRISIRIYWEKKSIRSITDGVNETTSVIDFDDNDAIDRERRCRIIEWCSMDRKIIQPSIVNGNETR